MTMKNTEDANTASLTRVVRWPLFTLIWSASFGTLAATCWATGMGTPTIQAATTGFHAAVCLLLIPQLRPSNVDLSPAADKT